MFPFSFLNRKTVVKKRAMEYLETLEKLITGGASSEIKFSTHDVEPTMPDYPYVFEFEKQFNQTVAKTWFDNNWKTSFPLVGVYLLAIVFSKLYMAKKPRYELKLPLFVWNSMLAVFSIWGTLRTLPEFFHVINKYGVNHSICYPRYLNREILSSQSYLSKKLKLATSTIW